MTRVLSAYEIARRQRDELVVTAQVIVEQLQGVDPHPDNHVTADLAVIADNIDRLSYAVDSYIRDRADEEGAG